MSGDNSDRVIAALHYQSRVSAVTCLVGKNVHECEVMLEIQHEMGIQYGPL